MTKLTLLDKYKLKNNYCFCYFGTDAGARIRFLCQFPPPSQLSALVLHLALLCPLSSPADMQGKPRRCEQCRAVFSHAACPGTMFAPEICTPLLVIKWSRDCRWWQLNRFTRAAGCSSHYAGANKLHESSCNSRDLLRKDTLMRPFGNLNRLTPRYSSCESNWIIYIPL